MNLFLNSFKLLNSKEKFNLIIIFFLIIVSSILEMIGIGLILQPTVALEFPHLGVGVV